MGNYTLMAGLIVIFFFFLFNSRMELEGSCKGGGEWIVCILIDFSVLEIDAFRVEFSIIEIGSVRKK